jgi:hypothetical protein
MVSFKLVQQTGQFMKELSALIDEAVFYVGIVIGAGLAILFVTIYELRASNKRWKAYKNKYKN